MAFSQKTAWILISVSREFTRPCIVYHAYGRPVRNRPAGRRTRELLSARAVSFFAAFTRRGPGPPIVPRRIAGPAPALLRTPQFRIPLGHQLLRMCQNLIVAPDLILQLPRKGLQTRVRFRIFGQPFLMARQFPLQPD